jgi:hypothetical protein
MFDQLTYNKFKDYEIDVNHNNKIFSIFDECIEILLENNIDFLVTGSLALFLHTQKIYRTIGDIDFVIKNPLNMDQIYLMSKHNFILNNNKIGINILYKKNNRVEFHFLPLKYNSLINNSKKINFNNLNISLVSIKDIFLCKKLQNIKYDNIKQKDIDDIEFYSRYI